jgi:TRAP-type mannitol/chloroaromatic compound transport system permease large subunit
MVVCSPPRIVADDGRLRGGESNLLWFGVFIVIMIEMANITPPVGFQLVRRPGASQDVT